MAERVGAAHDKDCATAKGPICVCACRGTMHGHSHRGGRAAVIRRITDVTVNAVTHAADVRLDIAGTDAMTARQRAAHPVTVTVVQTDDPTAGADQAANALGQAEAPTVTGTVGPSSTVPQDLSSTSDEDLMQMFADLSEQGREDELWRVWEEMGAREEASAAAVQPAPTYQPPKPYNDLTDDELETAFADASSMGDEQGINDAYAEMDRREKAEAERQAEARRPPTEPAQPDNPFAAWNAVAGSPIRFMDSMGPANDETKERAGRAMRLSLGLEPDAPDVDLAQAMREDPRSTETRNAWALAWYRKLADAEGADRGMPDTPAGTQRYQAREAEEAAVRQAKEAEQAARDARAAAAQAGPGGPANLVNPTVEYERLKQQLHMYRGSPGVYDGQQRMEEARARAFGLDPATTHITAIDAAEKADARSRPEKAALVVAWYRHLAAADGVQREGHEAWLAGPVDDTSTPVRPGYTPANVAKPWATWQEIQRNAKADAANGDPSTYDRYTTAMRRAYGLPDDSVEAHISAAYNADPTTDNQAAALFISAFRELGAEHGIDQSDRLRYGPLDRGQRRRPTEWRESTTEQTEQIEALVARGRDYVDAYAEVHNVDAAEMRRQQTAGIIDRQAGESMAEALRRSYGTHVHIQYVEAESATRGHMLNAAGQRAGIDPQSLFSGPTARARAYASEDLLRWWEANGGRMTFTQFRAQVTGSEADRRAAEVTRRAAQGQDFG